MVMFQDERSAELAAEAFQQHFEQILPLILEEWPTLSREALLETTGDLSRVVDYVALKTEHTRSLTRLQLMELYQLAIAPTSDARSPQPGAAPRSAVDDLLHLMEHRTDELVAQFKRDILPELSQKARKNVGATMLISLGVGFLLGLLLGGNRER